MSHTTLPKVQVLTRVLASYPEVLLACHEILPNEEGLCYEPTKVQIHVGGGAGDQNLPRPWARDSVIT